MVQCFYIGEVTVRADSCRYKRKYLKIKGFGWRKLRKKVSTYLKKP